MNKLKQEQVPWSILDVGKALIAFIFLVIVSLFVKRSFPTEEPIHMLQPIVIAATMFVVYGILFLVTWLFTVGKYKVPFKNLGFASFNFGDGVIIAVFWVIVVQLFTNLYGILAARLFRFNPPSELMEEAPRLFGTNYIGIALAVFIIAFVAPFVEEIFFRGFVYSAIRKRIGVKWAIALSAVIFAVIHAQPWSIIPLVAIGVVLAYLYEKESSLGPPIILHCLNNAVALAIMYLLYK